MRKLTLFILLCLVPIMAGAQTLSTTLTGDEEVPGPGDPDGSGIAVITISGSTVNYFLLAQGIAAPTVAHIHTGAAGVRGDVLVDLSPTFTGGLAAGSVANVSAAVISNILGNPAGFYVNIHNAEFPDGAIRGQLTAGTTQGAGTRVTFLPVVGKVAGAAGTNFVTDIRILNQTGSTANVTLDFFASSGAGQSGPTATRTITVAPGAQAVLDDVMATLNASGLGGLRVTADQNVSVLARVINDLRASNQGTTGFAVDALEQSEATTAAALGFLSQASDADIGTGVGFRTNIGYFNPSSTPATVTFTARRTSDGAVLGSNTVTVPGFSHLQQGAFGLISSVPAGDRTQPNFYVTWTSTVPLFVYASVNDNKTGDPVFVQ
jgi:hypothetical protein